MDYTVLRQLPQHLREMNRKLVSQPVWADRLWLIVVAGLLFTFGTLFGCNIRNQRHDNQVREVLTLAGQANRVGEQCVRSLDGMARAAVVIARNEPRYVVRRAVQP